MFNIIKFSIYLIFANGVNIFGAIKSTQDWSLLKSDIDFIRDRCAAKLMKLNANKI